MIPKGTRTATTYEDLTPNTPLPNAVHIDPDTGEVTSVPRRYTKSNRYRKSLLKMKVRTH